MTTLNRLLAVAEDWDTLPADSRNDHLGDLLPHLDEQTALSHVDEAAEHLMAAHDIRRGVGDWQTPLEGYLGDAATGLEDEAEIAAAVEVARTLATAALEAAVAADRDALVRSQMDTAAELIDTLCAPEAVAPERQPA